MLWFLLGSLIALVIYHHVIYLPLMIWLGNKRQTSFETPPPTTLPRIALVMPAYNEAEFIEAKLANLLTLDYPPERLNIYIGCDGCTDNTIELINNWRDKFELLGISLVVKEWSDNKGKLERLNYLMGSAAQQSELIALTDVSALLSIDSLKISSSSFLNDHIGAVTSCYLLAESNQGEQQYWHWQNKIRTAESRLASVIGGNGAFYIMRSTLFEPLQSDTINDDFMLPMMVLNKGYQVILNEEVNSVEIAPTSLNQDFSRRQRIGAGNLQQLIRCQFLLHPKSLTVSWLFASGKGLRTLMPFILICIFILTTILSGQGSSLAHLMVVLQLTGYGLCLLPKVGVKISLITKVSYFISGYFASFIGMLRYLMGHFNHGWKRGTGGAMHTETLNLIPMFKRTTDILLSVIGLLVTLPLWPLIAIAIKLDSKGPIFYSQLRVGEIQTAQVDLFFMLKFRTMIHCAEQTTGAIWAQDNDPRVTKVGNFLRKTRLDELPQFLNVLKGEMSLIGPRPERPEFCRTLQNALPFYLERTSGLKPGITGLAQVQAGYDGSIEDVKQKLGWDHAYATSLFSVIQWLKMDSFIIFKTIYIMATSQGK